MEQSRDASITIAKRVCSIACESLLRTCGVCQVPAHQQRLASLGDALAEERPTHA
jgi:hypothetical protein